MKFTRIKMFAIFFSFSVVALLFFQNASRFRPSGRFVSSNVSSQFVQQAPSLAPISQYPDCSSALSSDRRPFYRCANERAYPSGISGQSNQAWDLSLPPQFNSVFGSRLPLLIVIHGGSWGGDKASERGFAETMAARGFVVANINYTTANGRVWDSNYNATLDIQSFVRLAFNSGIADGYKIDTRKISLAGFSAGGHLALMEATRGEFEYFGVFTGSAPTRIDLMKNPEDPAFSSTLDSVFGKSSVFRSEMSPYNRISRLRTRVLFMEHSQTDTIVPYEHGLQFYLDAQAPEKIGNPAAGDPIQRSSSGYVIGSHNFSSGSKMQATLESLYSSRLRP